ncbi:MAG TPA: hypothetical protein VGM88_03300 [Kofleriaceae bacterium]|jgi:hypothetical protein
MSTDPKPDSPESIELAQLETVTGGTTTPTAVGSNDYTSTISQLASELKNLGNIKQSSGFDNSTMLCLAMMAMSGRGGFGGFGGGTVIVGGGGGGRGRRGGGGCW